MLETLDLSRSLDKATYKLEVEALMQQLRSLQQSCWESRLPLLVVLEGWAAAGKGALVKKMVNYMDPRGFTVYPTLPPTDTEQQYPFLWRFWQQLPPQGAIGIFYHSWYTHVLEDRLFEHLSPERVPQMMAQINAFERQLADDGVAIAKFYLHLSRKELKHRLKKTAKDELTAWRVRPEDWQQHKRYHQYVDLAEEMLIQTSTGIAPWTLVESDCKRWARVKVLSKLVAVITEALDRRAAQPPPITTPPQATLLATEPNALAAADLSLKLERDEYKDRLRTAQLELRRLQQQIFQHQIPVVLVFEGWDAAGKGGAIKRLTDILDPRSYRVNPYAAPTEEENRYHYLWRFWRTLPPAGKIGICDRSWYGRVLVERVEGFATDMEWRRAYREINEFETQLTTSGYVVVKFWLHIDPEEQLRRFEQRRENPFRQYKLTDEDWRNRDRWSLYDVAVNQMIGRTSTPTAPWVVVPGNDKYYARVFVIETVIQAIRQELTRRTGLGLRAI
ncbi:polyphosphate:AMP phosphotransferase [Spirulina major CS-329]|uniref:polyphosphate:AMP phosphotransferase n=1 Tax=Spirulina TaxID=1154 RepID=UPI00233108C7|nr:MULTISPECIES: polyphosphate:AMP phosphotransferase [Spirulina]MDB9497001.1 polyphosphate:AMP phosphotransferase [Spirulina subsalsa CS-330]MDB9503390.1 polyphosphate:AMP phosphotransferase [Spirulina major CS-329]